MKLLEDLKLTGRMLGCHQVTAEVLGPEAVRFSSQCVFFLGGKNTVFIHGNFTGWWFQIFSDRKSVV